MATHRVDRRRVRALLLVVVLFLALWVVLSLAISATLFRAGEVDGDSMSPTLRHGEQIAVLLLGTPGRQDIVVLDGPPQAKGGPGFLKRVVAVGGDTVSCCSSGHLVVNGAVVSEPYAVPSQPSFARVRVPQGDVFVLGDNRMHSQDSRSWGPIPRSLVIGTVVAQGGAAVALSPIALGGVAALVLTGALWIFWIRHTAFWRGEPGPGP